MIESFKDVAEIGDVIKAYDVPPIEGMPDRFIAGVVLGKGRVFQNYGDDRRIFLGEGYTVEIIGGDKKSVIDKGRKGTQAFVPYHIEYADHDDRVTKVVTAEQRKAIMEYFEKNPDALHDINNREG